MRYYTHIPCPALSAFIDCFWYCEGYSAPHAKERVLPNGSAELVISLRDKIPVYNGRHNEQPDSYSYSVVSGVHSEFIIINTDCLDSLMGVHFRPGGIVPFLRMPASELYNVPVSLDAIWGAEAHRLHCRLLEAATVQTRFAVLEQALLAQASPCFSRNPGVTYALQQFHQIPHTETIAEVTGQIGLSQKKFIHIFRKEIGLTPKLYCRIQRFQEVLRRIKTGHPIIWADTASACGYFDQAHFIHDFQAFSGLNPSAYLSQHRGNWINHVPHYE